jgi:hypothetical protein
VVFRVGERTGKVTVSGAAACALPPDVLPRLATAIVDRLTELADRPPGPADRPLGPADRQPGPDDRQPDPA